MGLIVSSTPCPNCGSLALFLDETPECVRCSSAREKAGVGAEKVGCGLDELLAVVSALPPEDRRVLALDVDVWRYQVERLADELAAP